MTMDCGEDVYACVGVCMADPDSGFCLGCGRPPLPMSSADAIVAEAEPKHRLGARPASGDPDSPA